MQRLSLLSLLLLCLIPSCTKDEPEPQISANENIFINEIYPASGEDWIEIYNGNDAEKNLSGYKIFDNVDNKYELPAGTVIPAKAYLVLICDDTGTGLHTNFKLSAGGETVFLENVSKKVIDKVEFPPLVDGESYGRYPDGSATLKISTAATKGASNGNEQGATIASVTRTITIPQLNEVVRIKSEVTASTSISSVKLFYRIDNNSFTSVEMTKSGAFYEADIPGFSAYGRVEYYVTAQTEGGKTTFSPFDAPDETYHYLLNNDELPVLYINEYMAVNSACCPDQSGEVDEFDDWIEIYNPGSSPIDLGDFYFSDDPSNPFKDKVSDNDPEETTIPAGGFLLFWADEQNGQGPLHLSFKLSADGESVGLYYKDGRAIDNYTFGGEGENISRGRSTDGGETWKTFSSPTPGESNE